MTSSVADSKNHPNVQSILNNLSGEEPHSGNNVSVNSKGEFRIESEAPRTNKRNRVSANSGKKP